MLYRVVFMQGRSRASMKPIHLYSAGNANVQKRGWMCLKDSKLTTSLQTHTSASCTSDWIRGDHNQPSSVALRPVAICTLHRGGGSVANDVVTHFNASPSCVEAITPSSLYFERLQCLVEVKCRDGVTGVSGSSQH